MLFKIVEAISEAGGRAYLVGGYVRDHILEMKSKDHDIEVFGIDIGKLEEILSRFGTISEVGRSFGVIKLSVGGYDFDFSLPRRDSKCSPGHKGFIIETDPSLSIEEAAYRRDFTFNSMSIDPLSGEILDPYDGGFDILFRVLRHTSDHFAEDPLRVLRGFQFCGRYNLKASQVTINLCRSLLNEFEYLAIERIWGEWEKWATKSTKPGAGLRFLEQTGWIQKFPELNAICGLEQDKEWHPEGDVWEHTIETVDATQIVCEREGFNNESKLIVILAALCHDIGKPTTVEIIDGRIRNPGHASDGIEPTKSFLKRIGCPKKYHQPIEALVKEHMVHLSFKEKVSKKISRRLLYRLGDATPQQLCAIIEADHRGRGDIHATLPDRYYALKESLEAIESEIKPILLGRHLIDLGYKPGPHFGLILKGAFEAQLDGEFETIEGGLEWIKKQDITIYINN